MWIYVIATLGFESGTNLFAALVRVMVIYFHGGYFLVK